MSMSQRPNVIATDPACQSAEIPRILHLEDSPGEAELFCHALVRTCELLESRPESPRPEIDMQHTAQPALDVLRKQVALEARGLPDLIVLDLNLPGGTSLTFLQEL